MTANNPMTGEQLDELMTVAVNMQRDSEKAGDRPTSMFAYAVQVAVLELRQVREMKLTDENHVAAMNSIKAIIAILGSSDTLGISEQVAELKAQRDALAAENAGLKAGIGFFSYDSSGSYEEHDTADKAAAYAEDSISEYRDNAPDGWSDEVGSVVWGVIMQRATMTGLRPVTEEDNVAPHIEEFCDYTLLPNIENPATDAYLAEVRAQESKRVYESILDNPAVTDMESLVDWLEQNANDSVAFALQLRKGAQS